MSSQHAPLHQCWFLQSCEVEVDSCRPPGIKINGNQRKLDSRTAALNGMLCRAFPQCFFKIKVNSSCRRSEWAATSHMHYLKQSALISKQAAKPSLVTADRHTLNKDCFVSLLYSTHVISKGLFAWLDVVDAVWVGALMVSLCSDS